MAVGLFRWLRCRPDMGDDYEVVSISLLVFGHLEITSYILS